LTSPFDGAWFENHYVLDFGGDSSEPGTVELQWFDNSTQQWAHCFDLQTSGDSFVNDQGETRYPFLLSSPFGMTGNEQQYAAPGIVDDNGQRSNEIALTVWGWGFTNTKEPGHYVSIYETCGREQQQCCYGQEACDSGFNCTQSCYEGACTLDQNDICTPAPSKPNPPKPKPQPASTCGVAGEDCCQGNVCSTPNSVCVQGTCAQPGVWWGVTCECTVDEVSSVNVEIEICLDSTAQQPPYAAACSAYAGDSALCAPLTPHGPDPSRGQCSAVAGNIRGK
jgi:hypothetical protein